MRLVHWLFLLSMAFFISGVGLVVASGRTSHSPAADIPALTAIATTKQIMQGMVGPGAQVVYKAVGTTMTAAGDETWAPKTQEEWDAVGTSAAAIAEAGNLILIGNRKIDNGDWVKMARAMTAGAQEALQAIKKKDADALFAAGEPINISCDSCHEKYERK